MRERVGLIVGRRIRDLRQAKGWSQEKLAEEADLDRTYIGRIERGEKNIGLENLVKIAQALGESPALMIEGICSR